MRPLAWYDLSEDDRRISVAQTFLWLSCAGGLIGLGIGIIAGVFGHVELWSMLAAHPLHALVSLAFLALYVAAAYLTGQGRATGGLLGLALFGYSIVAQAVSGHIVTWNMAWSVLGVILIVRAAHALKLPVIGD
jgi:hypothetical protein